MTPSKQGDLGELKFQELCLSSNLHPTVQYPDRYGKAFIIEWPMASEADHQTPVLDKMRPPLTCIVQVKTVKPDKQSVRLSLTAAMRLLISPLPAFVAAFEIDEDGTFNRLAMFSIRDKWLGKVLRAVRKAQSDGKPLSRRSITVNLQKGDLVQRTLNRQDVTRYVS